MRRSTFALTLAIAAVAVILAASAIAGRGDDKPQPKKETPNLDRKKIKEKMDLKLEYSQKLLAALIRNDLKGAQKHAEDLVKLRKDPMFKMIKSDTYEFWSDNFSGSADKIIKGAKDLNLDMAKMGYLEMTLTCFNCHTYVRDYGGIGFERTPSN